MGVHWVSGLSICGRCENLCCTFQVRCYWAQETRAFPFYQKPGRGPEHTPREVEVFASNSRRKDCRPQSCLEGCLDYRMVMDRIQGQPARHCRSYQRLFPMDRCPQV